MSETTSTTDASEGNSPAADAASAGGPADGGAGTQVAADASAVDTERLAKQARDFQSARDKAIAERDALAKELAAARGAATPPSDASQAFSMQDYMRIRQLDRAAATVAAEFSEADPGIFERVEEFDSVEALQATAERSHNARKAYREKVEREAEERMKALLAERGIKVDPDPAPPTGSAPAGDPTPADLNRMTPEEWEELERKSPGVIDRVLAANSPSTIIRTGGFEG